MFQLNLATPKAFIGSMPRSLSMLQRAPTSVPWLQSVLSVLVGNGGSLHVRSLRGEVIVPRGRSPSAVPSQVVLKQDAPRDAESC